MNAGCRGRNIRGEGGTNRQVREHVGRKAAMLGDRKLSREIRGVHCFFARLFVMFLMWRCSFKGAKWVGKCARWA